MPTEDDLTLPLSDLHSSFTVTRRCPTPKRLKHLPTPDLIQELAEQRLPTTDPPPEEAQQGLATTDLAPEEAQQGVVLPEEPLIRQRDGQLKDGSRRRLMVCESISVGILKAQDILGRYLFSTWQR